ncbi:MAG: ABC transporter permease [Myxococcota bacterium]
MWSNLLGDLFEPILYLVGLGYGLGHFVRSIDGMDYLQFIAPGMVATGAMWSACFENTYGAFTRMARQKTYVAIMMTPIDIEDIVLGDILWAATKATIGGAMVVSVCTVLGLAHYPSTLLCVLQSFLTGLCFGGLAMLVTSMAPNYDFFTYFFTVFLTPFLLLSEAWYPLDGLPPAARVLAEVVPLTHAVRPMRAFMTGGAVPWSSLWVLTAYALVFSAIAAALVRRRLIR